MKTVVIHDGEYINRPDGVSLEAWDLHCNRLEQGKESDPFEAQRTIEHMFQWGISETWREKTKEETAKLENKSLDDFFLQHSLDACGVSGYESSKEKKQTVGFKKSNGSIGFFFICALAIVIGVFLGLYF